MTSPRRPPASRQLAAPGRPSAGRRPARPAPRSTAPRKVRTRSAPSGPAGATTGATDGPVRPAGPRARRRGGRLGRLSAGRVAVLVLVVVTLVVSAALPLREFVSQRREIAALAQANADAERRVAALGAERKRLDDPEHIAAEARRRLHFVLPGETAYVVIPPVAAAEKTAGDDRPWYTRLWDSVEKADRPPTGS